MPWVRFSLGLVICIAIGLSAPIAHAVIKEKSKEAIILKPDPKKPGEKVSKKKLGKGTAKIDKKKTNQETKVSKALKFNLKDKKKPFKFGDVKVKKLKKKVPDFEAPKKSKKKKKDVAFALKKKKISTGNKTTKEFNLPMNVAVDVINRSLIAGFSLSLLPDAKPFQIPGTNLSIARFVSSVPEPSSVLLFSGGLLGLALSMRGRKRA